ncbi:MAG: endopeptidase La [Rikenellaceae bacterium]
MKKYNIIEDLSQVTDMIDFKSQIIPLVDDDQTTNEQVPPDLPILALRSSLIFPGSINPITVGREKSIKLIKEYEKTNGFIGTVLQRDPNITHPEPSDLYTIGTTAKILKVLEMPDGNYTVILNGVDKIEILNYTQSEPYLRANVKVLKDANLPKDKVKFEALIESVKDIAISIISLSNNTPKEAAFAIKNIDSNRGIINFICSNLDLTDAARQQLLETPSLQARANLLLEILIKEQQLLKLKEEIQRKVKRDLDNQQKEYYLQQQLRTIQEELGDDPADREVNELIDKAQKKKWEPEVASIFYKEAAKLERMNPAVAEFSVQMNYLQLMLDLPWNHSTKDNLDLERAKKCLDNDHFGLKEVKERIIEHLAVLKLKGDLKSPIICLYGPPGVGKTSLGKSVARSLKRKFGRISLGGLHDESEIRGHRKTYIGAMPGRIIQTIKKCGSANPVIILDEIDKVSIGAHGDPASALLEVLDPEQNTTFHDNYLDIEYDLSKALFIATANNISNIPDALRDRMEMINIAGYLPEEKVEIARKHLIPKQIEAHGLTGRQFKIKPNVIDSIITSYTRESGVRTLNKIIAKIARHRAMQIGTEQKFSADISKAEMTDILGVEKFRNDIYEGNDFPGVVTGLAWTQVGGDILYIESSKHKGKGGLIVTGNLGDVMKESTTIALAWVKAHCEEYGISPEEFEQNNIHVHVPEGAIPKDGPSAGITMVTSLVSLLTQRKVKERIAMTGETTLRGKVLPVGGLKEKLLAAKRAGITDVIVSSDNNREISEIEASYLEGITIHYATTLNEVLELALV